MDSTILPNIETFEIDSMLPFVCSEIEQRLLTLDPELWTQRCI